MMRSRWLLFSAILFFATCVDDYPVPEIPGIGYLVVEGFINSNGPTTITLSRSMPLESKSSIPVELRAKVYVESEDNMVYPLTEQGKGIYSVSKLSIDSKKKYRIYIKTVSNQEYVSEYVEVSHTPPIGKITYEAQYEKGGVQIYVSTSDPDNAARYYHWDYTETWQYRSYWDSKWDYVKAGTAPGYGYENAGFDCGPPYGYAVWNPARENIFDCWMTVRTLKNIIITSTERLSQSVVQNFPLTFVPSVTRKIKIGYRITVRQSALAKEAYEYLAELKRNSEQQGSLFDPQPSALLGNLRCLTDPEEPVLGYVSAHNIEEKSAFIYGHEAPYYDGPDPAFTGVCPGPGPITLGAAVFLELIKAGQYLPGTDPTDTGAMPCPLWQPKMCVDCREQGGTNVKPAGWPFISPPTFCCPPR